MKSYKVPLLSVLAIVVIIVAGAIVINSSNHSASNTNSNTTMSNSTNNAVATNTVMIQNYMYMPATIKVKVGTSVTWTNKDAVQHNVVADNPSSNAPNGQLISQNQTYSFTFNKAGTYTFHCVLHPYMHGTVVVTS